MNNQKGFAPILIVVILVLVGVGSLYLFKGKLSSNKTFTQTKVGTIPNSYTLERRVVFSPDVSRTAYIVNEGSKQFVVIDGQASEKYDNVKSLNFSTDSKNVAYIVKQNGKEFIILNGVKGPKYDSVWKFSFSNNGKRTAYIAINSNGYYIVIDGSPKGPYDESSFIKFSPDSNKVAYSVTTGNGSAIVVDGLKGKDYSAVGAPVFSYDSKMLAYAATIGADYTGAKLVEGSSDQNLASFIVINEKEGKKYQTIIDGPVFSPKDNKIAYVVQKDFKEFLIEGEKEQEIKDWQLKLVPSGETNLFYSSKGTLAYIAENDWSIYDRSHLREEFMVMKNKKVRSHVSPKDMNYFIDFIVGLKFSKSGEHFAYRVIKQTQGLGQEVKTTGDILVFDGDEVAKAENESIDCPVVSNDGKIVYVLADNVDRDAENTKSFISVGNTRSQPYDYVSCPSLSSDEKEVFFGAKIGNDLYKVVQPL